MGFARFLLADVSNGSPLKTAAAHIGLKSHGLPDSEISVLRHARRLSNTSFNAVTVAAVRRVNQTPRQGPEEPVLAPLTSRREHYAPKPYACDRLPAVNGDAGSSRARRDDDGPPTPGVARNSAGSAALWLTDRTLRHSTEGSRLISA
jgi:hypothetical protein